jgi:ribose transport system permease protein
VTHVSQAPTGSTTAARARKPWSDEILVPGVILVLGLYLSVANQHFLTANNLTNILVQTSILALVAFGVTFVILAGELDLSVGTGMALISVVTALVAKNTGSLLVGIAAGVTVGVVIGLLNGIVVTKFEVPSFVATLGMMVIAQGAALALSGGAVIAGLPESVRQINNTRVLGLHPLVILMFAAFAVLLYVERKTVFGVRVLAVGGNAKAARLSRVPVDATRIWCFVVSGVSFGIAGAALTVRVGSGQPNAGGLTALMAVAAVVIGGTSILGGKGSVTRTLAGVFLIAVLQNGLDLQGVDPDMQQVAVGVVFIFAASTDYFRRRIVARRRIRSGLSAA